MAPLTLTAPVAGLQRCRRARRGTRAVAISSVHPRLE
jgi:hypothetical protein